MTTLQKYETLLISILINSNSIAQCKTALRIIVSSKPINFIIVHVTLDSTRWASGWRSK
jgi:hypothetical protein